MSLNTFESKNLVFSFISASKFVDNNYVAVYNFQILVKPNSDLYNEYHHQLNLCKKLKKAFTNKYSGIVWAKNRIEKLPEENTKRILAEEAAASKGPIVAVPSSP